MEKYNQRGVCSICGNDYYNYGNNAKPVNDGRCCNKCNLEKVIPARLQKMKKEDK